MSDEAGVDAPLNRPPPPDLSELERGRHAGGRRMHKGEALDGFDYFCRFLNAMTAISALMCAASYVIALIKYRPVQNVGGVLDQALRVFGVLGCVLIAAIETEWGRLLSIVSIAEFWVGRAIFQIYWALFTEKMGFVPRADCPDTGDCHMPKGLEVFRVVSAIALLACGGLYLICGLLCIGLIKSSREKRRRRIAEAQAVLAQ